MPFPGRVSRPVGASQSGVDSRVGRTLAATPSPRMGAGLARDSRPVRRFGGAREVRTVWKDMFVLQVPLLEKVLRTALVYSLILVLVRLGASAGWPP